MGWRHDIDYKLCLNFTDLNAKDAVAFVLDRVPVDNTCTLTVKQFPNGSSVVLDYGTKHDEHDSEIEKAAHALLTAMYDEPLFSTAKLLSNMHDGDNQHWGVEEWGEVHLEPDAVKILRLRAEAAKDAADRGDSLK